MGEHHAGTCGACGISLRFVTTKPRAELEGVRCWNCATLIGKGELRLIDAERVTVDSRAFLERSPNIGDVVACLDPSNPDENVIKRIVGLPSDRIQISDEGLLLINGQLPFRIGSLGIVCVNDDRFRRAELSSWSNAVGNAWQQTNSGFAMDGSGKSEIGWLEFCYQSPHAGTQPNVIYDETPMNVDVGRELLPAACVVISGRLGIEGEGTFYVRSWAENGDATWESEFETGDVSKETVASFQVKFDANFMHVRTTSPNGSDREERIASETKSLPGERRFSVGARNLNVKVSDLRVQIRPRVMAGRPVPDSRSVEFVLGENEYYLLGDNATVSVDSRHWDRAVRRQDIVGLVRKNE